MFRILVLGTRNGIHSILKYLLYRYELMFSYDIKDAVNMLNENNIDMIIVDLPLDNGNVSDFDILKKWTQKKKTIAVADVISPELIDEANKLRVLAYIDKLDIAKLPELVGRYLNQAETRILSIVNPKSGNQSEIKDIRLSI